MKAAAFFKKLRRRLWSTEETLLLFRPAGGAPLLPPPCPVEIRAVTEENLRDCDRFSDLMHNSTVFGPLLQRGDLGYYGYDGGVCVSCLWSKQTGGVLFGGGTVQALSPRDTLIHYVYVDPAARGRNIQAFLIQHALERDGFSKNIYACVLPHNAPSLKNFLKNGFQVRSRLIAKHRLLRSRLIRLPVSGEKPIKSR